MSEFTIIPSVVQHVSFGGIAVDSQTNGRLSGVMAMITTMPPAFQRYLDGQRIRYGALWSTMTHRADLTATAPDGSFYFKNLPSGTYTVTFTAPRSTGLYGTAQALFMVPQTAEPQIPTIPLPATGVRGTVWASDPGSGAGAPMTGRAGVLVRVQGSGETAHTTRDGTFYLPNIDVGTRVLEISSPRYNATTSTVGITLGVVTDAGTITLTSTP